jgi:hypothetical protein
MKTTLQKRGENESLDGEGKNSSSDDSEDACEGQ